MSLISIRVSETQTLSKNQQTFNKLSESVQGLRQKIEAFEKAIAEARTKYISSFVPLKEEHQHHMEQLALAAVKLYGHPEIKRDKKDLKMVLEALFESFEELPESLHEGYEKVMGRSYLDDLEEANVETSNIMKEMMSQMLGVEFDDDADVSTPEKMQAYIEDYFTKQQAQTEREYSDSTNSKQAAPKPKTAKQLEKEQKRAEKAAEKEAKMKEEEKKVTKSVREVYMELVKSVHPDLEQDPTERDRKTAIMQKVTAAYENNDLLGLLQLQLELEHINHENLASLADEKLALFNKLLRQQQKELQWLFAEVKEGLSMVLGIDPTYIRNPEQVGTQLNRDLNDLKNKIRIVKSEIQAFSSPTSFRRWLKGH